MKSTTEILNVLKSSNCSEAYHQYSQIPFFPVATDGVIALAEAAGCYWLLDIIGSYQTNRKLDPEFQVWELKVDLQKHKAIVHGYNDATLIITQRIPFTDFPLEEVKLYLINGVILLPSEY